MKLAVFGATGKTGLEVIRQALELKQTAVAPDVLAPLVEIVATIE